MELLSTVDWLIYKDGCQANVKSIKEGLANWSAGKRWADRKLSLFKDEHIEYALDKLQGLFRISRNLCIKGEMGQAYTYFQDLVYKIFDELKLIS
jgi:hypothetical protein